ncbi:MAG TPA: hypothetical protein VJ783_12015 [Pirellulales bacterium]|nr:hypothetical protein [Pirellulales bacterium]
MSFVTGAERYGRKEGLAEGRAQGLAEGRGKARVATLEGIEAVLEVKFAAAGLALLPEIRQIDNLELLRNILQAAKQSDSPETLRRLWANAAG